MTYNAKQFKEKKVVPAGEQIKATITEIESGKLSDFVEDTAIAKWRNAEPTSEAIRISATLEDGTTRKKTIQLPADDIVHPKSNLAKWKKNYKAYPYKNQEIYLVSDGEGWFQFDI